MIWLLVNFHLDLKKKNSRNQPPAYKRGVPRKILWQLRLFPYETEQYYLPQMREPPVQFFQKKETEAQKVKDPQIPGQLPFLPGNF